MFKDILLQISILASKTDVTLNIYFQILDEIMLHELAVWRKDNDPCKKVWCRHTELHTSSGSPARHCHTPDCKSHGTNIEPENLSCKQWVNFFQSKEWRFPNLEDATRIQLVVFWAQLYQWGDAIDGLFNFFFFVKWNSVKWPRLFLTT